MAPYSPVRRMNQQSRRLRNIGVSIIAGLLLFLLVVYRRYPTLSSCDSPYANVYDVVFDAGSTGTRIYIFQFERAETGVVLLSERFRRVQPGLSSYATNIEGAKKSLSDLIQVAVEAVPSTHYACTSVTLKATAGLRLLPKSQQVALLKTASMVLERSPFNSRGASVIPGAQEGVYGWLTVNYLLGNLDGDTTAVTVDMGGASAQVVFETAESSGEWLPFNYAYHLRTPRRRIALYQHSYLGLGLNEAKRTLREAAAALNETNTFPCIPTGRLVADTGLELDHDGGRDFDACVALFRQHVVRQDTCRVEACGANGVPQPSPLTRSKAVYAFSYFYDRISRFVPDDAPLVVGTFREKGIEACGHKLAERDEGVPEMCMDIAYLYTFLTDGLGLNDTAPINVPNKIASKAVSWSLGSSLSLVMNME